MSTSRNYSLYEHLRKAHNKAGSREGTVILFPLASGNFGTAYLCYDAESDTIFIRKRLKPKSYVNYKELAYHAFLNSYCGQYVICMRDYSNATAGGMVQTTIDLEFMGFSLESFVKDNPSTLRVEDKIIVISRLVRGLLYIHSLGLVHRDIKPANIVINPNTLEIKYIDFGEACMRDVAKLNKVLESEFGLEPSDLPTKERNNECFSRMGGSPLYMAPEIFKDATKTFEDIVKTDIWSLGMTIYWIVTGKNLFNVENMLALVRAMDLITEEQIIKSVFDAAGGIDKVPAETIPFYNWSIYIILSMLKKDPAERADAKFLASVAGEKVWEMFMQKGAYSEGKLETFFEKHVADRGKVPVANQTKIMVTNEKGLEKTLPVG